MMVSLQAAETGPWELARESWEAEDQGRCAPWLAEEMMVADWQYLR